MSVLYAFLRFYPLWALGGMLACTQIGWFYHRKKHKKQYVFFGLVFLFFMTSMLWVGFRGDLYSDQWLDTVREVLSLFF